MTVRVRIHPGAVDALLRSPAMRATVEETAAEIARRAAPLAPVDTGMLRRSYKGTKATVTPSGVQASAYTWAKIGHIIEWGGARGQIVYAPLRRAASSMGLRLRVRPKGER